MTNGQEYEKQRQATLATKSIPAISLGIALVSLPCTSHDLENAHSHEEIIVFEEERVGMVGEVMETPEEERAEDPKPDGDDQNDPDESKGLLLVGEDFGGMYSENPLLVTFHLGATVMPEYNSDGENEGFQDANVFGRVTADIRYEWKGNDNRKHPLTTHFGASFDFFSEHVVNCEEFEEESDKRKECEEGNPDLEDLDFNDISDTFQASAYYWLHSNWFVSNSEESGIETAIGFRASARSREELTGGGDSINYNYSFGTRVVVHDFMKKKKSADSKTYASNGLPRLFAEASIAKFENFAGIENYDEPRFLLTAAYRMEKIPLYLGFHINGGNGPDEVIASLTWGLQASQILGGFQQMLGLQTPNG